MLGQVSAVVLFEALAVEIGGCGALSDHLLVECLGGGCNGDGAGE